MEFKFLSVTYDGSGLSATGVATFPGLPDRQVVIDCNGKTYDAVEAEVKSDLVAWGKNAATAAAITAKIGQAIVA